MYTVGTASKELSCGAVRVCDFQRTGQSGHASSASIVLEMKEICTIVHAHPHTEAGLKPDFVREIDAEGQAADIQDSRRGADFVREFEVKG